MVYKQRVIIMTKLKNFGKFAIQFKPVKRKQVKFKPVNYKKKWDYDGDSVPNMIDCQPKNPKKDSIILPFVSGFAGSYIGSAIFKRIKK